MKSKIALCTIFTIILIASLLLSRCSNTQNIEEPQNTEEAQTIKTESTAEVSATEQTEATVEVSATEETEATVEVSATEETEPTTEASAIEEPVVIAFLFGGTVSDNGWNYKHNLGRLRIEEELAGRVQTVYAENVPFNEEASRTAEQFIAEGADMVVDTTGYGTFFTKVVDKYPDIAFMSVSNDDVRKNLYPYYYNQGEVSYLIGVSAGLLTKSNKIGYIASFDAPFVRTELNAYTYGAQSVKPDVEVYVVAINSWMDPVANRQAAEAMVDSGVDFLWTILDDATTITVAEEREIWGAGANADMSEFGPGAYVSSRVVDWGNVYVEQAKKLADGTFQGNPDLIPDFMSYLTIENGGLMLGDWGANIPTEVQEQVEAIEQQMKDGWNPYQGPIYDRDGNLVVEEGNVLTGTDFAMGFNWLLPGIIGLEN